MLLQLQDGHGRMSFLDVGRAYIIVMDANILLRARRRQFLEAIRENLFVCGLANFGGVSREGWKNEITIDYEAG